MKNEYPAEKRNLRGRKMSDGVDYPVNCCFWGLCGIIIILDLEDENLYHFLRFRDKADCRKFAEDLKLTAVFEEKDEFESLKDVKN